VNPSPAVRKTLLGIALALLLYLTWNGLAGGVEQLSEAHSVGQRLQTGTQFGYGILSLASAVTIFWARRWNMLVLACWSACVAAAAGLASVAWGGTSVLTGVISGAAALGIAALVIWLVRAGARGLTRA
jgi:cation transport ATPase